MELSDVDGLVALLRDLQFPGRDLAVHGKVELEAEWFSSAVLRVRSMHDVVGTVEIGPHSFAGEDAPGLRRLLLHLLALAGLPADDYWWMLAGVYGDNG